MLTDYLTSITAARKAFGGATASSKYVCFEDYVQQKGTPFTSAPLTPDELGVVREAVNSFGLRNAVVKQCFYNAQMIAAHDHTRTLLYTEGFASGAARFPVLHGWLTINGKVVDVTWRIEGKKGLTSCVLGVIPTDWEYIGHTFDTTDVVKRIADTQVASSFIDDWKGGYPLLHK